ncbi:MAG: hypothetical protein HZB31_06115 [Nitrospirae bacterium]|nr:hypothetical protein [Nitrospirota bacterium]
MLDTVGFYVPISEEIALMIKNCGIRTSKIDHLTGEIHYEKSGLVYSASWSSKINIQLLEEKYQKDLRTNKSYLSACPPYLKIEFSACKYLLGHNIESIHLGLIVDVVFKLRADLNTHFGFQLPGIKSWYVYRLDTCVNYEMPSLSAVTNYLTYIKRLDYGRRKKTEHRQLDYAEQDMVGSGFYCSSSYDTFKVYSKGLEFKKHDMLKFRDPKLASELQAKADRILRFEVENKKSLLEVRRKAQGRDRRQHFNEKIKEYTRYLKSGTRAGVALGKEELQKIGDKLMVAKNRLSEIKIQYFVLFNGYLNVMDLLTHFDFYEVMTMKMKKFLNGTESRVMKSADVERILCEKHGDTSGRYYFSMYMLLITQGQNYVKTRFPRATYYKGLKVFRELGISFFASDIKKIDLGIDRGFPKDFSLLISPENKYYQVPLDLAA